VVIWVRIEFKNIFAYLKALKIAGRVLKIEKRYFEHRKFLMLEAFAILGYLINFNKLNIQLYSE
jgi:hypothetical protein